eukprot:13154754-Alexandrium_andersonii.AAC.1
MGQSGEGPLQHLFGHKRHPRLGALQGTIASPASASAWASPAGEPAASAWPPALPRRGAETSAGQPQRDSGEHPG